MKILMALMGLDIGGAETHVAELSRQLRKQGHDIILVSSGGAYVRRLEEAGIRHEEAPLNSRSAGSMLKSLRLLRKIIGREKPDLVHAHARIPAFLCGILQKSMHFPLITTAHWVFQVTPLLRLMTNWGDRTVAVSPDIRTYLMENYLIPSERIHVTINGIDTDACRPCPPAEDLRTELGIGSGPVVGLVSRLDSDRALAASVLVEIAPELCRDPDGPEILIVGGGDREAELRRAAEEANRRIGREKVHLAGAQTDIPAYLSLMDVFVGVSRAALEAMSAAKPVILAGNEGYLGLFTPEKLDPARETNFCLRGSPAIDGKSLLRDLRAVLAMEPEQRTELGAFGRQVILEEYSVERMTDDYLEAYQQLLHPPKPIRLAISGYYGYNNLGDDAILLAISRQLEKLSLPIHLTALSRHPKETARQYGIPSVQRFYLPAVRKTIRQSDALIFGGGSLLQDRTSTRSIRYYLWVIGTARRLGKPVFLYANGIGPISHPENRERVRRALDQCTAVTLRDGDSLAELESLGLSRTDCVVTGDPAFTLRPISRTDALEKFRQMGIPLDGGGIVGISVRPGDDPERLVSEFASLGDRIAGELHRTVVLVVMQESSDLALSREILLKMKAPAYVLSTPGEPETMLGLIGCMDALVSMRLHTIIFAARERVPVVGCVYDPKVSAFLHLLDMPSCGTPGEMTAENALDALRDLLNLGSDARDNLDRRILEMEQGAEETALLLQNMLENLPE